MITVTRNDRTVTPHTFTFPGGEIGVKFDAENYAFKSLAGEPTIITARLTNSEDVMKLVMIKNALEHFTPHSPASKYTALVMPYIPYARQDRVCVPGEAFSLQAFARLINHLNFDEVLVLDPHSDVTSALFNNLTVIPQIEIIQNYDSFVMATRDALLVSPDAGANKKTSEIAKYLGHSEFIRADKLRDLSNGKIKETVVYADNLDGRTVVICDDIADGGASFTGLAQVLKSKGAKKVILYVTHGIFSKGTKVLFESGIDEIYTTNSYRTDYECDVQVLDIDSVICGI